MQEFVDREGRNHYRQFFESLATAAAVKVAAVSYRLAVGNTSGLKGLGAGLAEWRLDWGPGIRIYVHQDGADLILLMGGSDKGDQQKKIDLARDLVLEYKARKKGANRAVRGQ
ncbi:type II toxin-antitoxin system RelE/ParE family toxin [Luteibacter pinisoli]|uniref:Type II toxin-antitoxin system RelE/ParE family toxin n=1 Tax=Luteibacter pinisoli TaxID=2589080 RepID=A0A4Y5Z7E1_9GAMM|nr:type II toxin-antitoxin system RelE/ParE family toxin [Luteibacter pinisoli]QDE40886.1 type II toxin-antitoxin system RelE/ParE family toxin [Luteibacter pinisoli]